MLTDKTILIIEDNIYLALDLSTAVEQLNGRVAGPACTAADAFGLLGTQHVAAAILDYELPDGDAGLIARLLIKQGVPFVIHTGSPVDPAISLLRPGTPILMKPVQPVDLIAILANEMKGRPDMSTQVALAVS